MANSLTKDMNRAQEATLTLFNEEGETYTAGKVTTLIHSNDQLKLRWLLTEPFSNALPFTHAMVHTGKKIWNVLTIKPLDNGAVGTEIEIRV